MLLRPFLGCHSEREDIINHGVLKVAVVRNKGAQPTGWQAGGTARPSELPQDNQALLKKLRGIKLSAHIDHAHSISVGQLGGKY
jgi:dethiobiotin synthetase